MIVRRGVLKPLGTKLVAIGVVDAIEALKGAPTNANDVELEATLQELALNLRGDAVETNMALGEDGACGHGGHLDGFSKVDVFEGLESR
jgi:hypothetical protein